MSLLHIRGVQPSKANNTGRSRQRVQGATPRLSGLHKNIQKVVATKKKNSMTSPSFGINTIMDQNCFRFFMDYCLNAQQTQTRIPVNTQECSNFLSKHNCEFVNERTQELSNAKVLITTKTQRKRNNATFVIQLPPDYNQMLVFLLLIKIDFGPVQIELSASVGKSLRQFAYKAKESGFRFYYDFIRLNSINKRFIIIRS